MGCFLWQNADKIAQILLVLIGASGLCFAWRQINSGRIAQREATAKAVYCDYLKLAFDHPVYDSINDAHAVDDKKYSRFVGILLNACDELALGMPSNEMWEKVISAELRPHARFLASEQFRDVGGWNLYSCALRSIGLRLIQAHASNSLQ